MLVHKVKCADDRYARQVQQVPENGRRLESREEVTSCFLLADFTGLFAVERHILLVGMTLTQLAPRLAVSVLVVTSVLRRQVCYGCKVINATLWKMYLTHLHNYSQHNICFFCQGYNFPHPHFLVSAASSHPLLPCQATSPVRLSEHTSSGLMEANYIRCVVRVATFPKRRSLTYTHGVAYSVRPTY